MGVPLKTLIVAVSGAAGRARSPWTSWPVFLVMLASGTAAPAPRPQPVAHHLVSARTVAPPLLQEVRYATKHNFLGEVLYPSPEVWVHRDVAGALRGVQKDLAREGLGLKIFDGYRPLSVQRRMWAALPDERYVSNPDKNRGRHTRGTAVDVTLVGRSGEPLVMPTPYDDFREAAHRSSKSWTPEQRANSLKLEAVMRRHGFIPYPFEWWHFDFRHWEQFPPLDISFGELARGVRTTPPVPDPAD